MPNEAISVLVIGRVATVPKSVFDAPGLTDSAINSRRDPGDMLWGTLMSKIGRVAAVTPSLALSPESALDFSTGAPGAGIEASSTRAALPPDPVSASQLKRPEFETKISRAVFSFDA